jgi:hypothetical protein
MTCVTDAGSTDLWLFDTTSRRWKHVDKTVVNNVAPSANERNGQGMTSVGLDLWLVGEGACYVCFIDTPSPPPWW